MIFDTNTQFNLPSWLIGIATGVGLSLIFTVLLTVTTPQWQCLFVG